MNAKYNSTARAQGEPSSKSMGMERYWAAASDMARAVILVDGKMYQRRLCLAVSSFSHSPHLWLSSNRGNELSWCAGRVHEAT